MDVVSRESFFSKKLFFLSRGGAWMRGHVKEIFKKIIFSFTWRRMDAGPRERNF
jgi:hypothetical protein